MGRRMHAVVGGISTEVLRMVSMLWMLRGIEYRSCRSSYTGALLHRDVRRGDAEDVLRHGMLSHGTY